MQRDGTVVIVVHLRWSLRRISPLIYGVVAHGSTRVLVWVSILARVTHRGVLRHSAFVLELVDAMSLICWVVLIPGSPDLHRVSRCTPPPLRLRVLFLVELVVIRPSWRPSNQTVFLHFVWTMSVLILLHVIVRHTRLLVGRLGWRHSGVLLLLVLILAVHVLLIGVMASAHWRDGAGGHVLGRLLWHHHRQVAVTHSALIERVVRRIRIVVAVKHLLRQVIATAVTGLLTHHLWMLLVEVVRAVAQVTARVIVGTPTPVLLMVLLLLLLVLVLVVVYTHLALVRIQLLLVSLGRVVILVCPHLEGEVVHAAAPSSHHVLLGLLLMGQKRIARAVTLLLLLLLLHQGQVIEVVLAAVVVVCVWGVLTRKTTIHVYTSISKRSVV